MAVATCSWKIPLSLAIVLKKELAIEFSKLLANYARYPPCGPCLNFGNTNLFFNLRAKRGGSLFRCSVRSRCLQGPLNSRVFEGKVVLIFGVGGWGFGKIGLVHSPTEWRCLFFDGAIYRGTLFSGQNAKTGPVRAMIHVEG